MSIQEHIVCDICGEDFEDGFLNYEIHMEEEHSKESKFDSQLNKILTDVSKGKLKVEVALIIIKRLFTKLTQKTEEKK